MDTPFRFPRPDALSEPVLCEQPPEPFQSSSRSTNSTVHRQFFGEHSKPQSLPLPLVNDPLNQLYYTTLDRYQYNPVQNSFAEPVPHADLPIQQVPVKYSQHSEHLLNTQHGQLGLTPQPTAPRNYYNAQFYSSLRPPLQPAVQPYPYNQSVVFQLPQSQMPRSFNDHPISLFHQESTSQQIGPYTMSILPFRQQNDLQRLDNIYGTGRNISDFSPLQGLGHTGNEITPSQGHFYVPGPHIASQTYKGLATSATLYDPLVMYSPQTGLQSNSNVFDTGIGNNHQSTADNCWGPFPVLNISGNSPDPLDIPGLQCQSSDTTDLFNGCPTSHDSTTRNYNQLSDTPAASPDLSDSTTEHGNDSSLSTVDPQNEFEDPATLTPPSQVPKTTRKARRDLEILPRRSKPMKNKTPQKMRKKYTAAEQMRINAMRQYKACLSCRVNKKKCNFETPCSNCQDNETAKIFNQPCCRDNLEEVMPFRQGNSRMGQTESRLPQLFWPHENTELKRVELIPFKIDDGCLPPVLLVECRQFTHRGEELIEQWQVNGKEVTVNTPPYAWFDRNGTMKDSMSSFMDECKECMEETMLDTITDELLKLTLKEAIRYAENPEGSFVNKALKIRAGAFLIASSFSIQGEERLDVPACPDPTPTYLHYPLPTVLEYQIDTLAIYIMKEHLNTVLRRLKKLISSRRPRDVWYEAFLLIFILLSTIEFVYEKQRDYIKWHEGTKQAERVNRVAEEMMRGWEYSALTLIKQCRFVLRAHTPFTDSWEDMRDNGLDENSAAYLSKASELVRNRRAEFASFKEKNKNSTEFHPFSWLSQLFAD